MSNPTNAAATGSLERSAFQNPLQAHIVAMTAIIASIAVIAGALALLIFVRPSAAAQATASGKPDQAASAERGKKLFVSYGCYECHGRAAQGGVGPRLGPDPLPLAFVEKYVRHPTASMPPYTTKTVSDQELADIYAYLKSLPQPPKENSIPLLSQ
ncbi:MAG: cytochrome c [Acidobacteriota bacterium]|nr:cytochrome c [Acidobacteriota bacterium]